MAKRGRPRHPDILTPREWEVLALLREGLSNREIGERLEITERGARHHVSGILSKLGVGSREAAAAWEPEAGAKEERPWWVRVIKSPLSDESRFTVHAPIAISLIVAVLVPGLLAWGMAGERLQEQDWPLTTKMYSSGSILLSDGWSMGSRGTTVLRLSTLPRTLSSTFARQGWTIIRRLSLIRVLLSRRSAGTRRLGESSRVTRVPGS